MPNDAGRRYPLAGARCGALNKMKKGRMDGQRWGFVTG